MTHHMCSVDTPFHGFISWLKKTRLCSRELVKSAIITLCSAPYKINFQHTINLCEMQMFFNIMSKSHLNRPFFFFSFQRNYSLKATHPDDQILSFIVISGGVTYFQLALFCHNSIYIGGPRKIYSPSKLDRRPSKISWLHSSLATFEAIQVSIVGFREIFA